LILAEIELRDGGSFGGPLVRRFHRSEILARSRSIETRQERSLAVLGFYFGDFIPLEIAPAGRRCESWAGFRFACARRQLALPFA
jgi:hypothetical protein